MLTIGAVSCDIYLHNPRGSNNRLKEQSPNRANANRIFDSENNDRGGYNVGNLFYYEGSQLQIEWTNQHSCGMGGSNGNCNLIIQYMCSPTLRDGSTTSTIPASNSQCNSNDCSQDTRFGMHEDYSYFQTCLSRQRNTGLYQPVGLRGSTAQFTRQNPGGIQSGTECSEERDYYPYWHPTQWIDIAILTDDVTKCDYYLSQSENGKSRFYCSVPDGYLQVTTANLIPNNQQTCEVGQSNRCLSRTVLTLFRYQRHWCTTEQEAYGWKAEPTATLYQSAKRLNTPVTTIWATHWAPVKIRTSIGLYRLWPRNRTTVPCVFDTT